MSFTGSKILIYNFIYYVSLSTLFKIEFMKTRTAIALSRPLVIDAWY